MKKFNDEEQDIMKVETEDGEVINVKLTFTGKQTSYNFFNEQALKIIDDINKM